MVETVCYTRIDLWMVVWAVVEVMASVGVLPVNTGGQLASILNMDVKEGNGSFGLFLHDE